MKPNPLKLRNRKSEIKGRKMEFDVLKLYLEFASWHAKINIATNDVMAIVDGQIKADRKDAPASKSNDE